MEASKRKKSSNNRVVETPDSTSNMIVIPQSSTSAVAAPVDEKKSDAAHSGNSNTNNNNNVEGNNKNKKKRKRKEAEAPNFPAISAVDAMGGAVEYRKVRCPPHRLTPLRNQWDNIMSPVVEYLKLQIRFNPATRSVELKTSELTEDSGAIQKGQDFIEAFMMGFEVQDAVALLRLDDLFVDSFMVTDVKMLAGDHLSRAIGRIAGQDGKTKYAIENATRTRVVVADQKIHILGSFTNIKLARDAICNLIIGAPPGKVYNQMRNVAKRLNERL